MAMHLRRHVAALGTVLGLGIALPFAVGVTPAYAQAQMDITKTHTGNFTRGGEGVYRITVTNTGDETGQTEMTDVFPQGLTFANLIFVDTPVVVSCSLGQEQIRCNATLPAGESYTIDVILDVATDAPCSVTNNATVSDVAGGSSDTASDPTTIPGPDCNDDGNGGGGSILPINLNGVLPMFNNITTNNNIHSPGASNASGQVFGLNAP
ncbi:MULTISPECIES: hypothetical protein [unclassified Streptomyces]|uniref:hypothetical protein n=1 Tax=unclassified Streptomyces TaxID=2593676 RepID=UPI0033184BD2